MDSREIYLVMGYGETPMPEVELAFTIDEAFNAVARMVYGDPSPSELLEARADFCDFDERVRDGFEWHAEFEIGGIHAWKVCASDDVINALAASPTAPARPESPLCAAVEAMVAMLEAGEWAEHAATCKAPGDALAARLESAITDLHNEIHEGQDAEKVAADFAFPPMPHAVVMHDKVGPLFDRLSMQFYAEKCMCLAVPQPAQTQVALTDALGDAARDVIIERQRQMSVEGWTPEHDDEHCRGEMSMAAACYALHGVLPYTGLGIDVKRTWSDIGWNWSWWKPTTKRRNLVKAAALILAEIERIDRAAALSQKAGEQQC